MRGDKKAYVFFGGFWLVNILLGLALVLVFLEPAQEQIFDKDFTLLRTHDMVQADSKTISFYLDKYVDLRLHDKKSKIFDQYLAQCQLESGERVVFLYSEKRENQNCIEDVDLGSDFVSSLSQDLKEDVEGSQIPQHSDLTSSLLADIDYVEEISELSLHVSYLNSFETKINQKDSSYATSQLNIDVYERSFSLAPYLQSLEMISEVLSTGEDGISLLSSTFTQRLVSDEQCKEEKDECIEDIMTQTLKKYPQADLTYDIEVYRSETEEEDFDLYIVSFNEKETSKEVLSFSILLENRVPLGLVEFELYQYQHAKATLGVKVLDSGIEKSKIHKFVVLYSYEDFFANKGSQEFRKLVDTLSKRIDPSSFENPGVEFVSTSFYYSDDIEMNFAVANPDTSTDATRILLNQIYDFETGSYELLDTQRPIYVYVFAIDSSFNYYLNEEDLQTQSLPLNSLFTPTPINNEASGAKSSFEASARIPGLTSSIYLEIKNYALSSYNFDHFDVYITKDFDIVSEELREDCQLEDTDSYTCFYYGNAALRNNGKVLISSLELTDEQKNNVVHDTYLGPVEFTGTSEFALEENEKYRIFVIPVDTFGNSITQGYLVKNTYEKIDTDTQFSYYRSIPIDERAELFSREVIIENSVTIS